MNKYTMVVGCNDITQFGFPAGQARDSDVIAEYFAKYGRQVADTQQEMYMWAWVLCTDGSLWPHDRSHGGGGVSDDFVLAGFYAHARTLRLADGPDEVHRNSLAKLELAKHLLMPGEVEMPVTRGS